MILAPRNQRLYPFLTQRRPKLLIQRTDGIYQDLVFASDDADFLDWDIAPPRFWGGEGLGVEIGGLVREEGGAEGEECGGVEAVFVRVAGERGCVSVEGYPGRDEDGAVEGGGERDGRDGEGAGWVRV
jgi:hypothetical protein